MNAWTKVPPALRGLVYFGGARLRTSRLELEAGPALAREYARPTNQSLMEKAPKAVILFRFKSRM